MISHSELKRKLRYSPSSGTWTWLVAESNVLKIGDVAGSRRKDGYLKIYVNGKQYLGHRLAWFYMTGCWPKGYVDHRDGNPSNDKWTNLREASNSQNNQNRRRNTHRTNGSFKGAYYSPKIKRWVAAISHKYIGCFLTEAEAHAAYCREAKRRFGEFARTA